MLGYRLVSAVLLSSTLIVGCGEKSASEYMKQAQSAVVQGDQDRAIIELKNVLRLEPKNPEARFLIGKIYAEQGQWQFAQKELERALEYQYEASEVVPLIADVYRKMGENTKLIKLDLKAKGMSAADLVKVNYLKAKAYYESDQEQKAMAIIDDVKKISSDTVYKQLTAYLEYKINEQNEAALVQLEQVVASYPNEPEALLLMAQEAFIGQDANTAIEYFARYKVAAPNDHEHHFMLAQLLVDQQRYEEAEPLIDELLQIASRQPYLNQLKALVVFAQDDYEQAFKHAEIAIEGAPEDTINRLIAGTSAFGLKNYDAVYQHLSVIASLLPDDHQALRLLAKSQLQLGHVLEANDTAQRFVELDEQDAVLLSSIAGGLSMRGEKRKAGELLKRNDSSLLGGQGLTQLGLVKLSLNDVSGILDMENALADTEEAASKISVQRILARAYLREQEYDKAKTIAEQWQSSTEYRYEGAMLLGTITFRQGELGAAENHFKAALELQPGSADAAMALIDILPTRNKSDVTKMVVELEKMLEQHPSYMPAILKHYTASKMVGLPNKMLSHVEQLKLAEPSNTSYDQVIAKMYVLEKMPQKAIGIFESIKTDEPQGFWPSLATAYVDTDQFEKAVELYRDWIEQQPNNSEAIFGMARVYQARGEIKLALELTSRYKSELGGEYFKIDLLHVQLLISDKQYSDAEAHFTALPANVKKRPYSAGLLGQLQLQKRQFNEAKQNLTLAYQARPTSTNATLLMKVLIATQGKTEAAAFLSKHLEIKPNDQTNLMHLASLQLAERPNDAIATYRKAVALNDKNFVALNNLAYLLLQEGQLAEATAFAEQALVMQPENANVLDTLAQIAVKGNQLARAETLLARAMEMTADKLDETIFVNYVEVLLLNNKTRLAQRQIERHEISDQKLKERLQSLQTKYNI